MASYVSRVEADIAGWQDRGLIDPATADLLRQDINERAGRAVSFGAILALLAALLFASALLVFVAADWDAIPRAVRTAGLAALVGLLLAGGLALRRWQQPELGEAVLLVASAAWGGALILAAQMYSFGDDPGPLILAWCLGTALAAALLASKALTVSAAVLAGVWLVSEGFAAWQETAFPYWYPVLALVVWATSLRSDSVTSRNVVALSLTAYGLLLALQHDAPAVGASLCAVGAILFVAAARRPAEAERWLKLSDTAAVHCLAAALGGLAIVQFALADGSGFALSAIAALIAIAAALLIGGRGSRGVRRLAYLAFAAEIGLIFFVTVGTLLDTAGFFLAAAVLLAILAVAIIRLERRWADPLPGPSAAPEKL